MKLTTGIVALVLSTGAWAQNPAIIQNTKDSLQKVQQQKAAASNAALQGTAPSKPSGAVPAKTPPAAPAVIPAKAPVTAAKPAVVPAKAPVPATPAKPQTTAGKAATPAKTESGVKATPTPPKPPTTAKTQSPMTPKTAPAKPEVKVASKPDVKPATKTAAKAAGGATAPKQNAKASSQGEAAKSDKPQDKKYSMTGKRDPFISPVVNRQSGSGCSTGKKCLDIEQIALHGVVKSDNGMIAVVTNSLNKAYFLRENDPVFNGYVVKITVDSIVFKQTLQDRLGKPFTKDVVKRILTPAV